MTDERPEGGGSDSPRCYRVVCESVCPIVHALRDRPSAIIDEGNQHEELEHVERRGEADSSERI